MRMIQILNNIINYFFKALRIITIALAVILWICLWIVLYLFYKSTSKSRMKGFNHPNFILLTWIMAINKKYKGVIF